MSIEFNTSNVHGQILQDLIQQLESNIREYTSGVEIALKKKVEHPEYEHFYYILSQTYQQRKTDAENILTFITSRTGETV